MLRAPAGEGLLRASAATDSAWKGRFDVEAVVLAAGQGRRLLPLTRSLPKCLLPLGPEDLTVLDFQLRALAKCGVERATVMVGFAADQVASHLRERPTPGIDVRLFLNPLHAHSDNLVTAWLATLQTDGDFVLMNGDTLFEPEVLRRALDAGHPVSVVVNHKDTYDADDMCVWVEGTKLVGIGKEVRERAPDGEAIGLYVFRGEGVAEVRHAFEQAVARPEGLGSWYPPVLEEVALRQRVGMVSIDDLWWTEIDVAEDLEKARVEVGSRWTRSGSAPSR